MPKTKKIMVMDDEAGIRNLLFDVLSLYLKKCGRRNISKREKLANAI